VRVIVVATPAFALPTLDALWAADDVDVAAVVTNPDRPAGRGLEPTATPASEWAREHGVPVYTTDKLAADPTAGLQALGEFLPVFATVVVASGLFIPKWLREENAAYSLHGAINLHPSLLPRWRGAAPIAWTIMAGDEAAGVTTISLVKELDEGPVFLQRKVPVAPGETAAALEEKLATAGAALMLETLRGVAAGTLTPTPQPQTGATYAPKITAETQLVDWAKPADELERLVRGLYAAPLARVTVRGQFVQILEATAVAGKGAEAGTVEAVTPAGVDVACGEATLRLVRVKPAGKNEMSGRAFALGRRLVPGDRLG